MEPVVIYGPPNSSYAWSTRMTVREKDLPLQDVNVPPHSPEIIDRHPFGKVPAMQHGDIRLFETTAIMRYLAEGHDSGTNLVPDNVVERAKMEQWLSAVNDTFYDTIMRGLVLPRLFTIMRDEPLDAQHIRAHLPLIQHRLAVLDKELGNRPYLAGEVFSLADILLIPMIFSLAIMPEGDAMAAKLSNLHRWQKAVATRTSFIETMPGFADEPVIVEALRDAEPITA